MNQAMTTDPDALTITHMNAYTDGQRAERERCWGIVMRLRKEALGSRRYEQAEWWLFEAALEIDPEATRKEALKK